MGLLANNTLNDYGLRYEWKLNTLEVQNAYGLSNVITSINWTLFGYDANGYSGSFNGVTPLSAPDSNNFIEIQNVTPNTVVSMIQNEIANDVIYIQHIDDIIYNQISINYNTKTTLQGNSMPWSSNTYLV